MSFKVDINSSSVINPKLAPFYKSNENPNKAPSNNINASSAKNNPEDVIPSTSKPKTISDPSLTRKKIKINLSTEKVNPSTSDKKQFRHSDGYFLRQRRSSL